MLVACVCRIVCVNGIVCVVSVSKSRVVAAARQDQTPNLRSIGKCDSIWYSRYVISNMIFKEPKNVYFK